MSRLTVALCTRNRAASLALALERLCALRIPDGVWWEVVVVDNASTDRTPDVIAQFAKRLPISAHVERKPGVANAYGPRGTFMNCQYRMNNPRQGSGTCTFSDGATYDVHLGS